jgi:hypothetical protein
MATKIMSTPEDFNEIHLEIDGLHEISPGTFVLRGVKPIDLGIGEFEKVSELLRMQGVTRVLSDRLVDEAIYAIQTGLLADALAQRTRRVG